MAYSSEAIREAYNEVAEEKDRAEKKPSLRTEIPTEFIRKYLRASDVILDAGGGTGINAIMMAQRCKKVTLVDISPKVLELAAINQECWIGGLTRIVVYSLTKALTPQPPSGRAQPLGGILFISGIGPKI